MLAELELPQSYSVEQFEKDISNVKPRFFDTYVLPPFLMYYAYKSTGMKKLARRILFAAGVYMFYRSYASYKQLATQAVSLLPARGEVS